MVGIRHGVGVANGEGRNRTGDTTIFSRVLYQLSYLAARPDGSETRSRPQRAHRGPREDSARRADRPSPATSLEKPYDETAALRGVSSGATLTWGEALR